MDFCQVTDSFERQPKYVVCYPAGTVEALAVFKQRNELIKLSYKQMTVGAEYQVD